jgi:predicted dienelactone hydrolase
MTLRRQPVELGKDAQVTYQPLAPGRFGFDVHTRGLPDANRGRTLPCDVWCPFGRATRPLVLVSHFSGGHRRSSTFLGRHLASHGYAVAAIDHSEIMARLNSLLNRTPTRRHEPPVPGPSSPAASRTYALRWKCSLATPNWPSTAPESVW